MIQMRKDTSWSVSKIDTMLPGAHNEREAQEWTSTYHRVTTPLREVDSLAPFLSGSLVLL